MGPLSPGFQSKPWARISQRFQRNEYFFKVRQSKRALYPQGFKANPGLELARAFKYSLRNHFKLGCLILYRTGTNHDVKPTGFNHGLHVQI